MLILLPMKVTTIEMRTSTSILSSGLCRDFLGFFSLITFHWSVHRCWCDENWQKAFANVMNMILWYGIMRISKQNLCSGKTIHQQYTHGMTTIIIIVVIMMTTCEWMLSEQKCGARPLEDFPLNPPEELWWSWRWWWGGGWFMFMMMMIFTSKPESGQSESLGARSQLVRFTLHVVMFTWALS